MRLSQLSLQRAKGVGLRDFFINGEPLAPQVGGEDLCFEFGAIGGVSRDAALIMLLEQVWEENPGRAPLYICPACGDVGCGAVSVEVGYEHGLFWWSDFALEYGADRESEFYLVEGLGPFAFREEDYREVFERYLREEPSDKLAYLG